MSKTLEDEINELWSRHGCGKLSRRQRGELEDVEVAIRRTWLEPHEVRRSHDDFDWTKFKWRGRS